MLGARRSARLAWDRLKVTSKQGLVRWVVLHEHVVKFKPNPGPPCLVRRICLFGSKRYPRCGKVIGQLWW